MLGMNNGCTFAAQESNMFATEWYIKSIEDKIVELHYKYGGHLKLSNKSTLEVIWDFCSSHFIVERNYLIDLATSYYFFFCKITLRRLLNDKDN